MPGSRQAPEQRSREDHAPLERLLELARSARDDSLMEVLAAVASTVTEVSGFKVVTINLHRPAWDDYEAVLVRGNPEAAHALRGTRIPAENFMALLATQAPALPGLWFFRASSSDWMNLPNTWAPDTPASSDPRAWTADDGIVVTLSDGDGLPLGFLSIDEPLSGLQPTLAELELLRAICGHAEQALQTARHHRRAQEGAAMNAHLLRTSRDLIGAANEAEAYAVLCAAVAGLGFERAFVVRRTSQSALMLQDRLGWGSEHPPSLTLDAEEMERVLSTPTEPDDLLLCPATEMFAGATPRRSQLNGHGREGWNDHLLLVPVWDGEHRLMAVLVIEDPVDHRLPSPQQRELLRLLADQAGATLSKLQLEGLHRRLLGLVLLREGASALATALAEIVQAPVAVLDWLGQPIAEATHAGRSVTLPDLAELTSQDGPLTEPPDIAAVSGVIVRKLRIGERIEGYLVVDASGRPGSVRAMAVEQAAMSFALHLAMAANADEVEHRLRGTLIDELLDGEADDLDAVSRRALRLGHDLSVLRLAVAIQPVQPGAKRSALTYLARTVQRVIEDVGAVSVVAPHHDSVVALLSVPGATGVRELGDAIAAAATAQVGLRVSVGISRIADSPETLAAAIREAQLAVRAARTVPSLGAVTLAGELDFHHLLLTAPRGEETVAAAARLLSPLLDDSDGGARLLLTLRVYLDAVGNLQTTADRLGLHVNSVRHRLTRIQGLLGRDLRDARTRVDLHLALEVHGPTPGRDEHDGQL